MNFKRTNHRPLFIVVGAVALGFLLFLLFRVWSVRNAERNLAAVRQAGFPASPLELDRWYVSMPAAENAALLVIDATLEHRPPAAKSEIASNSLREPWSEAFLEKVPQYLANNRAALEKLHQLPELTASRYPVDLSAAFATLLPHLAHLRSLSRLLAVEAIHHSLHGRSAEAARALESALALSRTLRTEPILISQLVRSASLSIALNALERVLNEMQLSAADASRLKQLVTEAEQDTSSGFTRALIGERAFGVAVYQMNYSQFDQFGVISPSAERELPEALYQFAFYASRLIGQRERDLTLFLHTMGDYISASTNGFPEALSLSKAAERRMQERFNSGFGKIAFISKVVLPSLSSAVEKEAMLCARLRCARLALAIEAHRAQHNSSIPSLAEVMSDFGGDVPGDPFAGEPLHYNLENPGYSIICRGAPAQRKNRVTGKPEHVGIHVLR